MNRFDVDFMMGLTPLEFHTYQTVAGHWLVFLGVLTLHSVFGRLSIYVSLFDVLCHCSTVGDTDMKHHFFVSQTDIFAVYDTTAFHFIIRSGLR